jgi:hypothetical protein
MRACGENSGAPGPEAARSRFVIVRVPAGYRTRVRPYPVARAFVRNRGGQSALRHSGDRAGMQASPAHPGVDGGTRDRDRAQLRARCHPPLPRGERHDRQPRGWARFTVTMPVKRAHPPSVAGNSRQRTPQTEISATAHPSLPRPRGAASARGDQGREPPRLAMCAGRVVVSCWPADLGLGGWTGQGYADVSSGSPGLSPGIGSQ